ncbi:MAG: hypothetical protein H6765_03670 [Candidatus Peribacteria bacterium]|nr:MAG: hypothetical protein H6765_03670 [Candidatus Peribacteria bacterium]
MLKQVCGIIFGLAVPLLSFAAPVRFEVTVNPSTFTTNTFVDVTVKAIDANGNVDTSYTEYVWMEIE